MDQTKRKEIGAFYTPYKAAKVVVDWAISSKNEKILEPSFGGCSFLEACADRLIELGANDAYKNIYGCDIDSSAFDDYLFKIDGINKGSNQFKKIDFLKTNLEDLGGSKFDTIIGNPPYVSYHSMSKDLRALCESIFKKHDVKIKGLYSLWMPFVLKSLEYLENGGNVGYILPNSLLDSDYALELRSHLKRSFKQVTIIRVAERLFKSSGTNEISVLLLCEEFNSGLNTNCIEYTGFIDKIESLNNFIIDNASGALSKVTSYSDFFALPGNIQNYYKIGDVYQVKIGIVTGLNSFFVINKNLVEENQLDDKYLRWVLKNARFIPGISVTEKQLEDLYNKNENVILVSSEGAPYLDDEFINYCSQLDNSFIENNKTFNKRNPWHALRYEQSPDCFMAYMIADGPRLIVNHANVTCTNNLHRLYAKEHYTHKDILLTSLSLLTSFSQLSAEIEGKNYGSGLLKIEPTACKNIKLLQYKGSRNIRTIQRVYEEIDLLFRLGDKEKVTKLVDEFFFESYEGNYDYIVNALNQIRKYRYMYNGKK